jgi:hypothetical protein
LVQVVTVLLLLAAAAAAAVIMAVVVEVGKAVAVEAAILTLLNQALFIRRVSDQETELLLYHGAELDFVHLQIVFRLQYQSILLLTPFLFQLHLLLFSAEAVQT